MTPIKGRLRKNTTPTGRRTAALTPNLQKDPQQRRPSFDDSSYPDSGYVSKKAKYTKHKPHSNEATIYKKIKAHGKLARTFQSLYQSALKTFAPFQEIQKSNSRPQELCPAVHMEEPCPTLHFDEVTHSATAPGATLLTMTSSSTLDRSRYLRSQISSGYIATWPQRPEPRYSP